MNTVGFGAVNYVHWLKNARRGDETVYQEVDPGKWDRVERRFGNSVEYSKSGLLQFLI